MAARQELVPDRKRSGGEEGRQTKESGKKGKRRIRPAVAALIAAVLGCWVVWSNVTVGATVLEIRDENLPKAFDGYRIAQISDFHNALFGRDNGMLLRILQRNAPDIIVLTGDLVDSNRTDIDRAVSLAGRLAEIAPCYYVTGNHERWIGRQYEEMEKSLAERGVTVLHNQTAELKRGGDVVALTGIDDPDFANFRGGRYELTPEAALAGGQDPGTDACYRILLSHRPELFETYADAGINLAFCGHAHGGQFRIPFVGGIFAPNQGLFPKYDSGIYRRGDTSMIVSRGVGNSVIPVRINNRPEIVIAVLRR